MNCCLLLEVISSWLGSNRLVNRQGQDRQGQSPSWMGSTSGLKAIRIARGLIDKTTIKEMVRVSVSKTNAKVDICRARRKPGDDVPHGHPHRRLRL